jgi:membrane dipeptidase
MLIVDAHLDLAYNALRGRDVTRRAADQTTADNDGTPSVGLPDLRDGRVDLICATIFCEPVKSGPGGYKTPDDARSIALQQLAWYRRQVDAGLLELVTQPSQLPHPGARPATQQAIILMEGADPLRTPDDVPEWFDAGLRAVGLAWKSTRMAGGTGEPGPLTPLGRDTVKALDAVGVIHDASHLAEESFWQLLELSPGPVMASHSNCRAIVPTDRQLSDDMIKAIAQRGGVIGINFFDKFLLPPNQHKTRRATFDDLLAHVKHITDLTGTADHVGIGTDMDGGFGVEHIPEEIRTSADLPKLATALAAAGYSADDVANVMGNNWVRFFRQNLPTPLAG